MNPIPWFHIRKITHDQTLHEFLLLAVLSIHCLGWHIRKTLSGLTAWLLLQSYKPFQFTCIWSTPLFKCQYTWLYSVYIHPRRPLFIKSVCTLPWTVSRNHLRRINSFPGAIMPPLQMSANSSKQFPTLLLSAPWAQLLFWFSEATLSSLEDQFSHQETLITSEDKVTQAPVPECQQEWYRISKDLENQTITERPAHEGFHHLLGLPLSSSQPHPVWIWSPLISRDSSNNQLQRQNQHSDHFYC